MRHAAGVREALAAAPDVRPDLVVGHSGFGSTLLLRDPDLGVPVVNLFEYFYRPAGPDLADPRFAKVLASVPAPKRP